MSLLTQPPCVLRKWRGRLRSHHLYLPWESTISLRRIIATRLSDRQTRGTVRLIVALLAGLASAAYCWWQLASQTDATVASDFTYHWLAGRALAEGQDPYQAIVPGGTFHLRSGYLYPLPTALVTLPFVVWLPPVHAAALFVGFSASLLTWALTRQGFDRLPALGGIPFIWAVSSGQLAILAIAGTLVPGLGWLALLKPNLGLALAAYRPSRSLVTGAVILGVLSWIVSPGWPAEWIAVIRGRTPGNYGSPFLVPGGFLTVLALLRWRRPEARLLFVMALIPQSLMFYDQLPLILVPKTRNESMLLTILGICGYWFASLMLPPDPTPAAVGQIYGPAIVLSLFLPGVVMVLRRPNEQE